MKTPEIIILYGGDSLEREVSLVTGRCLAEALEDQFSIRRIDLQSRSLPPDMDSDASIIFPALHGEFGEDGQLQALLEDEGFSYVGSDADSSALCLDKLATGKKAGTLGIRIPNNISFSFQQKPNVGEVFDRLGSDSVVKPCKGGSTIGLSLVSSKEELKEVFDNIVSGTWLIEERIVGRDLTVGLLDGNALGIVEIKPINGIYDYKHKYTPGTTEYIFPAQIPEAIAAEIKDDSERIFKACGCRDFARTDYILSDDRILYFLEINTMPGFTPTSTFPKSASCEGYNFKQLAKAFVLPSFERFKVRAEFLSHA